jgi:hypothetical protein
MATTKQTQMIAGRMVEFQNRFEKLPTDDSQWLIQNTGEGIDLCINAIVNRDRTATQTIVTPLSEIIFTTNIPATTGKFFARDKFKVDKSEEAEVKIREISDDFESWFIKKTEEPWSGGIIYCRKLTKHSDDSLILNKLGGQEKAEITLFELFYMMKREADVEAGELLTNGDINLFYIRDINGILRVVFLTWHYDPFYYKGYDTGWHLRAIPLESPKGRYFGSRVFSRVSSTQTA